MHSSTVQQQFTVSSRIVGICSSIRRRTAAVAVAGQPAGMCGNTTGYVGLVVVIPVITSVSKDSQASSRLAASAVNRRPDRCLCRLHIVDALASPAAVGQLL